MSVKAASEPASHGPSEPPYRKAIRAMMTTNPGRIVTGKPNSWKRAPSTMSPSSYGRPAPGARPRQPTGAGLKGRTRQSVGSLAVPYVFAFDHKHRRPPMEMKDLLGGKGANLAEMTSVLKLPVPPGFTISTDACRAYMHGGWPDGLDAQVDEAGDNARADDGPEAGRPSRPAARVRALGSEVLDARDDGHRPQPGAQRPQREGPGQGHRRRALRLRQLPAVHRHVRPDRARPRG